MFFTNIFFQLFLSLFCFAHLYFYVGSSFYLIMHFSSSCCPLLLLWKSSLFFEGQPQNILTYAIFTKIKIQFLTPFRINHYLLWISLPLNTTLIWIVIFYIIIVIYADIFLSPIYAISLWLKDDFQMILMCLISFKRPSFILGIN